MPGQADKQIEVPADEGAKYGVKEEGKKGAKPENEIYGVGGTAKDGGVSTADTVADGGANDEEEDGEFKPS